MSDKSKTLMNPMYDEDDEGFGAPASKLCDDFYDDFLRGSRMDTIYESYEEFVDSSDERSNETSSMVCSSEESSSARGSADSPTGVLRRSIRAWCDATGSPTAVLVEARDRSFRLHKFPLVSRSGYFKRILVETSAVKLPEDFPGGSETFQLVANFCYDPKALRIDSSNVAALRCSAEFLEMTEQYGKANLCRRTELYLRQVAFCSWADAAVVLGRSQKLLPIAEEVLIVSRCIDALAAVACLEIQDPSSSCKQELGNCCGEASLRSSLVKDLLELSPGTFSRFVGAARRQGMEERLVSQVIMEYTRKWLLLDLPPDEEQEGKRVFLLEALVRLLPLERFVIPLSILFCLHGRALAWEASSECRVQLENRIASQLELATIEDVLMSVKVLKGDDTRGRAHIESMQQIVALFMSQQQILVDGPAAADREEQNAPSYSRLAAAAVAKVWDEYLTEMASDPSVGPRKFYELSVVVPTHIRTSHDRLYKAINIYLKLHATLSPADRLVVCKALNCQKLTKDVCVHAVQNEHMPLRLIVQAMFMQQLQSRLPASPGESSQRMRPGAAAAAAVTRHQIAEKEDGMPLGLILQRDAAFREAEYLKDDFQATKTRLRELETELNRMKRNVQSVERKQASELEFGGKSLAFADGRRKKFTGSCICQVWGTQTNGIRLGQRITRTIQKLGFGSFWKAKQQQQQQQHPVETNYSNENPWDTAADNHLESGALRASSFRRTQEVDNSSSRDSRGRGGHSRHHSFS